MRAIERFPDLASCADIAGEQSRCVEKRILFVFVDAGDDLGFARPDDDTMSETAQERGERGAPASASDDCNPFLRRLIARRIFRRCLLRYSFGVWRRCRFSGCRFGRAQQRDDAPFKGNAIIAVCSSRALAL